MEAKVLVAYASKYGGTAEIAEKIGEAINGAGVQADVLEVSEVKDVTPYQAVVLGSAVYIGQWRKSAVKFVQKTEARLAERMVWLFSSGPVEEGDPVEKLDGWRLPEKIKPQVERIHPRDIIVFHGSVNLDKMNAFERYMFEHAKEPVGDFRDWEAIKAWAEGIAAEVKEKAPA